jgi:Asp-tRNA(Asn)/Glu-tRNA(Gln) amidotransferase A subunit family amidase
MRFDEYRRQDATALASLIAKKEVSAKEVLEAAIVRAEQVNPAINAIVHKQYDRARSAVAQGLPSGPLSGVPFLIKDLGFFEKGEPATFGSSLFKDFVADHDSAYVTRCKRAGLVIMGRSSSPEFGLSPNTEPRLYGSCRNPWNLAHSAGGSSGGAAAAVIAGILPMAHATDGGGSIRIPAALCGLFGLKPSRGRVSLAPLGETLAGAGAQHCVSMSVRDSAALLDAIAGGEPGDPYSAPTAGSFLAATQRPPGKLRVAFMRKPVGDGPLAPVLVAAVERTAKMLEGLGHHVEEAAPDYDAAATGAAFGTVMCANTFTNIEVRAAGRVPGPDDLEPVTRLHAEIGQGISAHEYICAVQTFHRTGRQFGQFFEKHDVLLSPTIARTHLPLGTVRMDGTLEQYQQGLAPMIPFTAVCNATGVPAMSVPLAWTDDGLPIGLHFVGRFGAEEMLFSLAAQLESAAPWRDRRPSGGNAA